MHNKEYQIDSVNKQKGTTWFESKMWYRRPYTSCFSSFEIEKAD